MLSFNNQRGHGGAQHEAAHRRCGRQLDLLGLYPDGVRTSATRRIEMPDLDEIASRHEPGDNPRIQTHAAIVIFSYQARLTVRTKELHHDIGLATSLNDMTARLCDYEGKEILLPWHADRGRRAGRGVDTELIGVHRRPVDKLRHWQ